MAIQTVAGREPLVARMLERLPQGTAIFLDEDRRGPLWNMERIMAEFRESGVLILQDDLAIPKWFAAELEKAWVPQSVMTFFYGMSEEPLRLWEQGYSYARIRSLWGQANWYPASFIGPYLEWSSGQAPPTPKGTKAIPGVRKYSGDDTSIGMFMRETKTDALMTLPHLVNHQEVKSTLGHPAFTGARRRTSRVFGEQFLRPWDKTRIGKMKR